MLKVYDPWENNFGFKPEPKVQPAFICYASELSEKLNCSSSTIQSALERALSSCISLNVSVKDNFHSIYCTTEEGIFVDYLLTPFACYLLLINADPKFPVIAKIQIHFASKNFKDVNIF